GAHGIALAGRGHGEPGLDDVHAQPLELLRNPQLLRRGHAAPRRLLSVSQRGVEDGDVGGHDTVTPTGVISAARFTSPSGVTVTGSRNDMRPRSLVPTSSICDDRSAVRCASNHLRPLLFSSIQFFAYWPDWISLSMAAMFFFVSSVTMRGPPV